MQIFDTPISTEILERDFQKSFKSEAKFGKKFRLERIGEGTGFSSTPVVITFDWTIDKEKLPKNALIKIVVKSKKNHMLDKFNDTELRFYEENARDGYGMKLPRFYCGRYYGMDGVEAGYIAVEFIENTTIRHLYHNIQSIGTIEVLEELAKLLAYSVKHREKMEKWGGFENSLISLILVKNKMQKHLRIMREMMPELSSQLDVIERKTGTLFTQSSFMQMRKDTCKGNHPVLCHGDIWTPNILWTKDDEGIFRLKAIVDWQFVHLGSPLEDLVLFFHSALSAESYRKNIFKFLHFYYEFLRKNLPKDSLLWESYEEFEKQYEIAYAYTMSLLLPMTVKMLDLSKSCENFELNECQTNYKEKAAFIAEETVRLLEKWF